MTLSVDQGVMISRQIWRREHHLHDHRHGGCRPAAVLIVMLLG
jgi:hypothetical protein